MTISAEIVADSVSPAGIRLTTLQLRKRFDYDPLIGELIWKPVNHPGWQHKLEGRRAGRITTKGYLQVTLNGKTYVAHVLIWKLMTGKWPTKQIDHKDGNKTNNLWNNLRQATNGQSRANTKSSARSGFKWVYPNGNGYSAVVVCKKKRYFLGHFNTPETAHATAFGVAQKLHGEFVRGS